MKKFVILLLSVMFIACVVPVKTEPRVVPISNRCCDSFNNVRCVMAPAAQVGSACYCFNQGTGHVC